MKTKHPTLDELERLLPLAKPFEPDAEQVQHEIWSILQDVGSAPGRMQLVCQLAANDAFSEEESDALVLMTSNELGVMDEDRHEREAGQLAMSLVRSDNADAAVKSLSSIPFANAVAAVAKIGLYNKGFVRRIMGSLEHVIENPDLIGW
jgi:hypothetical protein